MTQYAYNLNIFLLFTPKTEVDKITIELKNIHDSIANTIPSINIAKINGRF